MHPLVYKKIKDMLVDGINFIEVPVFFEAQKYFDEANIEIKGIIFVDIDKDIQVERLMNRNNITKEEAVYRIDTRITNDEKAKLADYIILNNSTHSDLKREVLKTLERINEEAN